MTRFLFIILVLGVGCWAHAAPEVEEVQGKKYLITSDVTLIEKNSSQHRRMDKNYQATVLVLGVGPSISSTYGAQFGKYLGVDSVLLLEITGGSNDWKSGTYGTENFGTRREVLTSSIGVHYKQFAGNSFYIRIGADYRTIKYRNTYINMDQSRDVRNFDGESVAANIQIGNQWQMDSFTLGCDWVGYSLPLSSKVKNFEVISKFESERRWAKEDSEMYIEKGHFNLLRLYLGASF